MLQSAKVINKLKQILALQSERNAPIVLRDLQPGVKVTLHKLVQRFNNSKTRSKIDGD